MLIEPSSAIKFLTVTDLVSSIQCNDLLGSSSVDGGRLTVSEVGFTVEPAK